MEGAFRAFRVWETEMKRMVRIIRSKWRLMLLEAAERTVEIHVFLGTCGFHIWLYHWWTYVPPHAAVVA